jgi:hypothetical protein
MAFQYPDKPWLDGQVVRRDMGDNTVLIGVYSQAKNLWSFARSTSDGSGPGGIVTTADVYTLSEPPDAITNPFDGDINIANQQDVNWYIYNELERLIYYGVTPPLPVAGEKGYHFWLNTDEEVLYVWNENTEEWLASGNYVKKSGDTMTGELIIDDAKLTLKNSPLDMFREAESLKDVNGDPILDGNGIEQWDPNAERFAIIESLPPRLLRSDGTYGGDTKTAFGIKVELDDGNTFRNQFKVGNRNGDAVTISGGTGPAVIFGSGFPGNQDKVAPGEEGKVRIKGIPTPDFETADDDVAVNKRYVDERDAVLQNGLIELEEEIDAIAPASERGKWKFTDSGTLSVAGDMTAYDQPADTSGNVTGLVQNIKSVWLHSNDLDGGVHSFENVEIGDLLEMFVQESEDYGLFEVVKINKYSSGLHWILDVNFIRTVDATTRFDQDEVVRLKIFQAPTAGNADDFIFADFSYYAEITS